LVVSLDTDSANDPVSPGEHERTVGRVRARSVGQTFLCGLYAAARLRPPQRHSPSPSLNDTVRRRFHLCQETAAGSHINTRLLVPNYQLLFHSDKKFISKLARLIRKIFKETYLVIYFARRFGRRSFPQL